MLISLDVAATIGPGAGGLFGGAGLGGATAGALVGTKGRFTMAYLQDLPVCIRR